MKKITMILLSALLLNPATVFATSGGFVEAIQMPAWYDRIGRTYPLKPRTKVYSGDIIHTSNNSRALLHMEEGSIVKLGENAILNFNTLSPPEKTDGVFAALLHIAKGAF